MKTASASEADFRRSAGRIAARLVAKNPLVEADSFFAKPATVSLEIESLVFVQGTPSRSEMDFCW